MTRTTGGRWIAVPLADGSTRHDWLPDEQPPSPDGSSGAWHIVGGSGERGRWEWHPTAMASARTVPLPPVAQPAAYHSPPAPGSYQSATAPGPYQPTPTPGLYQPPPGGGAFAVPSTASRGADVGGRRLVRRRGLAAVRPVPAVSRPGVARPGEPRPGEISNRTAIISIIAALIVLGVAVFVLTRHKDDHNLPRALHPAATPSVAARSVAPSPTTGSSADGTGNTSAAAGESAPTGAKPTLQFPKVSGDWTLYTITIRRDGSGNFSGTGIVAYTGDGGAADSAFTLAVFSGGRRVGTLTSSASAAPRVPTQIIWTSTSKWVQKPDGFTFVATE